jgi:protein subunit release factor A
MIEKKYCNMLIPEFSYTRKDFILDWYSGSGAGGQRRNKVQCCLRLTHIPSGITVTATENAHRNANLKLAFQRLKPLLEEWIRSQRRGKEYPKSNEIIRTYHLVENRVVDNSFEKVYSWDEIEKDFNLVIMKRRTSL